MTRLRYVLRSPVSKFSIVKRRKTENAIKENIKTEKEKILS